VNDYILKYIELAKFVIVQVSISMKDECFQHCKLNGHDEEEQAREKKGSHQKKGV
jgi:hypothetical protein